MSTPSPATPGEHTGATSIAGKWCVVTGASKGIGKAIAEGMAKEGACLLLAALHPDRLPEVADLCKKLGAKEVDTVALDLTKPESVEELAKRALAHGPVFVLVNNSGRSPSLVVETPLEGDPDEWDTNVRLNLMAPMRLTRRLAPSMAQFGNGHIINIGSIHGVDPGQNKCAYAATKWGLRGWTKSIYGALREKNIKVTCVNPGTVFTDMTLPEAQQGKKAELMIADKDIAEAVMCALKMGPNATVEEITVRNMRPEGGPAFSC